MADGAIPLQGDTLTPVPGGPVRTVLVTIPINGVPTQVQMQVVAIADSSGNILDAPYDPRQVLLDITNILKDIRVAMCKLADLPFVDNQEGRGDNAGVNGP